MSAINWPTWRLLIAALAGVFLTAPALAAPSGFGGFLQNIGQFDEPVVFVTSTPGMTVFFTEDGLVLDVIDLTVSEAAEPAAHDLAAGSLGFSARPPQWRGCVVRIRFDGAHEAPVVTGSAELPGAFHFFEGADPASWHRGARLFSEVTYQEVWPGIDLVFRITRGALEYDALVRPGADPSRIRFEYDGADLVAPAPDGSEHIGTPAGDLIHRLPVPGVASGALLRSGADAPNLVPWSPSTISWCTLLGGSNYDRGFGTTSDDQGRPVVVGRAASVDFPTTSGVYDSTPNGNYDAFVTKLDASGTSLVWSTYLGGALLDAAGYVAFDATGALLVGGVTQSQDFPTTPGAYDETASEAVGDWDTFVARLSPNGDSLLWSTYLGDERDDSAYGMTLDSDDNVMLTGHTDSPNFPTTPGAYRETHPGDPLLDAFVMKLAATGDALIWSTLLGADDGHEWAFSIALDSEQNPVIGGAAFSASFPTTLGAYDTSYNGGPDDGFLAKLSADGAALIWSTFVGGFSGDLIASLALEETTGDVLAAARTYSIDFPVTPGVFDETHNGQVDAAVLRLSGDGSALVWSTFVGGSGGTLSPGDWVDDLAIGPLGSPVIVGWTSSSNFPTTPDAYDGTYNGGYHDAFITFVSNDGSDLLWSTFFGGSSTEYLCGEMTEPLTAKDGKVIVTGVTLSADLAFPAGVWDTTLDGGEDALVLMITMPPVDAPVVPAQTADRLHLACSPNPFREGTSIRYVLPNETAVIVTVHDTAGRRLRTLHAADRMPVGPHRLSWDGRNDTGSTVAAGVYLIRVETPSHQASQRVVLLR